MMDEDKCMKTISIEKLNEYSRNTLMQSLGIQYTRVSAQCVEGIMPVDERTCQPFGILHGGATLALAETLAGVGSYILCSNDYISLGMQVSCNHVSSAKPGDVVRGVATPVQLGRSTHVWNVDVLGFDEKLISTVRVVNAIRRKKS